MSGESEFIAALRKLPLHPGARALEDDAALIEIGGETLILTHDMLVEGRHFIPGQDPADVAWKLVATNLSDLAGKGARPIGVLLGHMLGDGDERFCEGLDDVLNHYGVPLMGGDTVAGEGPRVFGLTAIGRATHRSVPSRARAQVGDALFVTGTIGQAMLGFEAVRDGKEADPSAYTRPLARLAEGEDLAPLVHAMMDVSDGLLLDTFRIAEASEVSIAIDGHTVPLADESRAHECMTWGDDYELLFTLPDGTFPPVPATRIGVVEARGFAPLFLDGEPVTNAAGLGYLHK